MSKTLVIIFIQAIIFSFMYVTIFPYTEKSKKNLIDRLLILIFIDSFMLVLVTILLFMPFEDTGMEYAWLMVLLYIGQIFHLVIYILKYKDQVAFQKEITEIRNNIKENKSISISDFYKAYKSSSIYGIYALFNQTKNMYYVGKSQNIVSRVKNHIEGRGNAHLFADLKFGDKFLIHLIPYETKFNDLNEQERFYIKVFDSYNRGYNRTRGG